VDEESEAQRVKMRRMEGRQSPADAAPLFRSGVLRIFDVRTESVQLATVLTSSTNQALT
jgi:hypothetical protein